MKKPTLLRGISIAGLAVAVIGIAVFVVLTFGNKKQDSKQPASQPVAVVQTDEQLKLATDQKTQIEAIQGLAAGSNYAKTIELSYIYANNSAYSKSKRLDAYGMCLTAAISANDAQKKEACFKEGQALAQTLTKQVDKDFWLKALENVYNGKPVESSGDNDGNQ